MLSIVGVDGDVRGGIVALTVKLSTAYNRVMLKDFLRGGEQLK